MAETVGSIVYDAHIVTSDFDKDATHIERRAGDVASTVEKSGSRGFRGFASEASDSFNSVADGLGRVLKSALIIGATGSAGIGAMVKASWDQVSAVQQATIALQAYEKDGSKVGKTLGELVAYARSDLGVLFNRKDLFAAAQGLKIAGDSTEELTDHVKIMSRSVGLGLTNWVDLTRVISRIGSTGRLAGEDFDNLTKAGFKLDDGMRNTNVTLTDLFKVLDKGIPADAMAGQANTVVGMGVRMQTAFRNLGDAILGVDADTGKFVSGGLGSKLIGLLGKMTALLKDPALRAGFAKIGKSIGDFATKALPIVIKGFTLLVNNMPTLVSGLGALAVAFIVAKGAAIAFAASATLAMMGPVQLVVLAITALVAALVFLQLRFNIFGNAWDFIKDRWGEAAAFFGGIWDAISGFFEGVGKWFSDRFTEARNAVVDAFNGVKDTVKKVIDAITGFVNDHTQAIVNWSIVIGTILLPKIVQIGVKAAVSAAQTIAAFVSMSASAIVHATLTSGAWIASSVATATAWLTQTLPKIIAQFAAMSARAVISAVIISATFILSSVRTLAAWALTFAGYLVGIGTMVASTAIAALAMAASWMLALGPIGLISALVIGVAALIIANWETVKGWFLNFWSWLKESATTAWNGIKNVFSGVGQFFGDVFTTVKNIFTSIGSTIGNAVGGAFKTVINSIIGFAENIINGFIRNINTAIGAINRIPGVDIKTLGEFNIPRLAGGGIVPARPGGILANLGEGGHDEAVIPLDKLDTLIRNDKASGPTIIINVDMAGIMARSKTDERDIAKNLIKRVNEELQAKGQPILGGGAI